MRVVVMVRHGQSLSNVKKILTDEIDGYPLTETGIQQAKETAEILSAFRFDGLWSSPVLRATQTAEIISGGIGVPVRVVNELRETEMGSFNGMKPDEALRALERGERYESWDSHMRRMQKAMESVNGKTVCVSHAMPITVLASWVLGLNNEESRGIDIQNASMTVIDLEKMKVLCIGSSRLSKRIREILASE